jgi:hypothetical protein
MEELKALLGDDFYEEALDVLIENLRVNCGVPGTLAWKFYLHRVRFVVETLVESMAQHRKFDQENDNIIRVTKLAGQIKTRIHRQQQQVLKRDMASFAVVSGMAISPKGHPEFRWRQAAAKEHTQGTSCLLDLGDDVLTVVAGFLAVKFWAQHRKWAAHTNVVADCCFHPDGQTILTCRCFIVIQPY